MLVLTEARRVQGCRDSLFREEPAICCEGHALMLDKPLALCASLVSLAGDAVLQRLVGFVSGGAGLDA